MLRNKWAISEATVRQNPVNAAETKRVYVKISLENLTAHVSYDSSQENTCPNVISHDNNQHDNNIKEWAQLYNSGKILMHDERSNPLAYISNVDAAKEAKEKGLLKRFCYAAMSEEEKTSFMKDYNHVLVQRTAKELGIGYDGSTLTGLAKDHAIGRSSLHRVAARINAERNNAFEASSTLSTLSAPSALSAYNQRAA